MPLTATGTSTHIHLHPPTHIIKSIKLTLTAHTHNYKSPTHKRHKHWLLSYVCIENSSRKKQNTQHLFPQKNPSQTSKHAGNTPVSSRTDTNCKHLHPENCEDAGGGARNQTRSPLVYCLASTQCQQRTHEQCPSLSGRNMKWQALSRNVALATNTELNTCWKHTPN